MVVRNKINTTKDLLLNFMMSEGRKSKSEKLFDISLRELQKKNIKNTKLVVKLSLRNVSPIVSSMRIKRRKVVTLVPFFLKKHNRLSQAIKLIVTNSNSKSSEFALGLSKEILDSSNNRGSVKNQVINIHTNSFANKNFSHFRWF